MKKTILLLLTFLCATFQLSAQEKIYQSAKLVDVRLVKDVQTFDYHAWDSSKKELGGYSGSGITVPLQNSQEKAYAYVQLGNVLYTVDYQPRASSRAKLGAEWVIGAPIDVRFNSRQDRMYLLQPDGKEASGLILRKERVKK